MKQLYILFLLLITSLGYAQLTPPTNLQSYYSGVDFTKTELDLFDDLAVKTASKHTNPLSYTPGIWESSKITDEAPNNPNNVQLFYGYSDTDGNYVTDTTRDKDLNGGNPGTDWNREHVFPNSLANPRLDNSGTSGPPYADAHNLRPSDVTMNSDRGNRQFAAGSGNATNISGDWYPGDEFKGDAARIIMYMYVRYGTQCYPSYAAEGTLNSIDPNMIDLLLQWNAEDPVSGIEDNRNAYHADDTNTYGQGNRNPFIDNPYLATVIWGGTPAQNRWGSQPPPDTQAPTTPTNLVASNPTETTIDLAWTASTDNVGVVAYQIFIDGVFYTASNSTATTFTVTDLTPETTYAFTVLARDAATNNSPMSAESNPETTLPVTTTGPGCISEDFETIPAMSSSYSNRTWTTSDGTWNATRARTDQTLNSRAIVIDVRTDSAGSITTPTVTGGIKDLTVSTLQVFTGSSGILNVYVNDALVGDIPYSSSVQTTTISDINIEGTVRVVIQDDNTSAGSRVAIDDLSWTCFGSLSAPDFSTSKFNIYPNPIKGSILNIKTEKSTDYMIFDIIGKRLLSGNVDSNNSEIDVKKLNRGVYILRLKTDNGSFTKKIIKE